MERKEELTNDIFSRKISTTTSCLRGTRDETISSNDCDVRRPALESSLIKEKLSVINDLCKSSQLEFFRAFTVAVSQPYISKEVFGTTLAKTAFPLRYQAKTPLELAQYYKRLVALEATTDAAV